MRQLSFSPEQVGILGGGQLARMLAESALRLGLRPVAYVDSPDCPAADVCADLVVAPLGDTATLSQFVSASRIVIFENEFLDCSLLRAACADPEAKFFPRLESIEILQDKLEQKKLLSRIGVATSPYVEIPDASGEELARSIQDARVRLGGDIVLKWSRQGYDGKGVCVVGPGQDALTHAQAFCAVAFSRAIPVYAEKKISFRRELAVIAVQSVTGENVQYPLVVSEQENGICKWVRGPATRLGVAASLQESAARAAQAIARETRLTGSFGIELFEDENGALLVNEIAPRVHNTGHYTQNAFATSQFENHWRAVLGLPLFDPMIESAAVAPFFAMLNLLGPQGISRPNEGSPLPVPGARSQLHWYAKSGIRPGRKLGHLNATATNETDLAEVITELKAIEKSWIERLQKGD